MNLNIGGSGVQGMQGIRSKLGSVSNTGGKVMNELRLKYPGMKFSVGSYPFSAPGKGNHITIDAKVLREMESNPDKRTEYEGLIKEVDQYYKENISGGSPKMVSQGFLLDKEGELNGWAVTKNNSGVQSKLTVKLNKDTPDKWASAITANLRLPDRSAWSIKFQS